MNLEYFASLAFPVVLMGLMMVHVGCVSHTMTLDADTLYHGYDARYVVPTDNGDAVRFDPRLFHTTMKKKAWIVTDPLDLAPSDGLITRPGNVCRLKVLLDADRPENTSITLEIRGSENGLSVQGWTPWETLDGLKATLQPPGRFIQLRATLATSSPEALPAVRKLALTAEFQDNPSWSGNVIVLDHYLQKPVRSPLVFHYGRLDHPDIRWFRKVAKLEDVISGKQGDFEKLVALNDFIGALPWKPGSPRIRGKTRRYEWDIRKTIEVSPDGTLTLHGHCMSYSEAMVTACVAMGYVSARHCAVLGFREASHEVVEVYVPDMGTWVYLDPTMTQYYYDKETRQTLNLLGMHDIVAASFVPDNKDMAWFSERKNQESRGIVRRVGGKKPIGARTGEYQFGKRTGGDYDWGWYHGYLAAGFVQITPRNDFQQHPEAVPDAFEHYPGYAGYPNWVDPKTPPRKGGENWFTRKRDYYWSLDQACLELSQDREPHLSVLLGNTMPFFASYEVRLKTHDRQETRLIQHDEPARLTWPLTQGVNDLEVTPIDEFGRRGLPSSVSLRYSPEATPEQ